MLVSKPDRPLASLGELLSAARSRVAGVVKKNEDDIFPDAEGLSFMLLHIGALILSFIAWVAVFFVGGDAKLVVIGIALATSGVTWVMGKLEKRGRYRANEAAEVGLGAFIMGDEALYRPDDGSDAEWYACFFLVTRDEALERDPNRLLDVSDRIGELMGVDPANVPADLLEVRSYLDYRGSPDFTVWHRLPRSFSGGDPTWLTCVILQRENLPNRHIDRPLWFVLYHRDHSPKVGTTLLPKDYWHSEQNEHLFYSQDDESDQQAG